ncbi:TIGR03667 family PPOX class F420-dependent oxidoreductase [Actinomadura sp. KC345]|uniref:pyridoxamine 5'-phosphate oxidase family protein n=1 Tax=Actinomadura sp. KC345 TaxID=2530371 RepID=UPI00104818C5|nr:pyridoxamine 5'-phosphate oxidase family protein [Actinomadura sp. KC345]TDC41069.1 TIGR03667 family PPOX class F420-dependent oxidoreductase [Actinomadura sp. KC345]
MLPGLEGERAARAEERLSRETVIWLTTVTPDGQPQTSPVGYVWNGMTFLIISAPGAPKVRNLRGNARVALHLDLDTGSEDHSVLTIEGEAELDHAQAGGLAPLTEDEVSAYLEKHREAMDGAGMTPEEAFTELSTAIRVAPTRARSY